MSERGSAEVVELVLFAIDGVRYAADLTQVVRVDRFDLTGDLGSPLGTARGHERALVIHDAEGNERQLAIDVMLGVKSVAVTELRRMPQTVRSSGSIGAWLVGNEAVLLVDLFEMTKTAEGKTNVDGS